jgi:hypothetical protein
MKEDADFKTALEIYNKSKKKSNGMFTKGRQEKIIILEYRSWLIILEPNFPSNNYVLTKKNASHGFRSAYCSNLESAIKMLYDQLIIANIDKNSHYGKKFADLHEIIVQTKKELNEFISPQIEDVICKGV